jgi:hypothetical protein
VSNVGGLVSGAVLLTGAVLLFGCGGAKEAAKDTEAETPYEAAFRPSDFDQPVSELFPQASGTSIQRDGGPRRDIGNPPSGEMTQGYRVQIIATTDYDEATTMKADVESQFNDEWFYLVYDPPTYKIRAGNFLERYEADRFARQLSEKGYKDAWVVPEKVLKNPPSRQNAEVK